jgi:2-polyprenyl-6-methoxyphenol hydroxylase-like FAD-dependent oxidoreductase
MMGSIRVGPNQHRMFLLSRDGKTTYTAEQFVEIVQTFLAPYKLEKVKVCDIAYFNVNERRASHYISRDKHVFLCGDAAHVHSPAGGQGMNMSIQDSENLAWKLAMIYHGQADAHILDTFAQERTSS